MKNPLVMIRDWIEQTISDFCTFITGIFVSVIAYLFPVKDIVNFLVLLFILDFLFGFWVAHKINHERFIVKKVWDGTILRMLFSIVLIILLYLWGDLYQMSMETSYKIVGGFISGVVLVSIIQNMYKLTQWSLFVNIIEFIKSRFYIKPNNRKNEED